MSPGIDLGFVFLGAARPHRALDARTALQRLQRLLDQRRLGQLAHADIGDLGGRHPQRHLVLDEVDDEQLELGARDLLLLDGQDLANAMGGIDHELVGLEALTLGQDLLLLDARAQRPPAWRRRRASARRGLAQPAWRRPSAAALGWSCGDGLGSNLRAVVFEAVAFAAVLAVLSGISLLLFFEDFAAEAFWRPSSLRTARARPLDALRLAAAAFLVILEALFLRVFCDTACARNCHAPV